MRITKGEVKMSETKIKFITEIEATITNNDDIPEDEKDIAVSIYEC